MVQKKKVTKLTDKEMRKLKEALSTTLEIYGKDDLNAKKESLRILNGWGRIIFIVSDDGKRIGLELTERWERQRQTDMIEHTPHA